MVATQLWGVFVFPNFENDYSNREEAQANAPHRQKINPQGGNHMANSRASQAQKAGGAAVTLITVLHHHSYLEVMYEGIPEKVSVTHKPLLICKCG